MYKFIFLMLLSFSAMADEWTTADTTRGTIYLTLHAIDWAQTLQISHNSNKYAENGMMAKKIIGNHPSVSQVNSYMVGSALLQYAIAKTLPTKYREIFQYITIADSANSVIGNFNIGLKVNF